MPEPLPSLPDMPGYGVEDVTDPPGRAFPWSEIEARLTAARAYWLGTTRHDGRPHVAPVWGVWMEDAVVFDSGRSSYKTVNLLRAPEAVMHLDDAENAVILHGHATPIDDRGLLERFAERYGEKYRVRFDPDRPPGIVFVMRPQVAFTWREELGPTATRWRFGPD